MHQRHLTILFAEILQERLISADGNPAFQRMDYSMCAVIKIAYKSNITYILTYFTLRTGKNNEIAKNISTKILVSQKLSNPSLNELKLNNNAIQNGLKHTNHGMIYNV